MLMFLKIVCSFNAKKTKKYTFQRSAITLYLSIPHIIAMASEDK